MSSLANCSCLIDADISGFIISLLYCLFLVRASESVYRYEILSWVEDRITGSPSDSDVQRRVDTWPTLLKNLISCPHPYPTDPTIIVFQFKDSDRNFQLHIKILWMSWATASSRYLSASCCSRRGD